MCEEPKDRRSSDYWSAHGFVVNQESYSKFMTEVSRFWMAHPYPTMDSKTEWKLQLDRKKELFEPHQSLVVQSVETTECFKVDMVVDVDNGWSVLRSKRFVSNQDSCLKLTDLGVVVMTARELFTKVLECAEKFGDYNLVANNCQDFCKVNTPTFLLNNYIYTCMGKKSHYLLARISPANAFGILQEKCIQCS